MKVINRFKLENMHGVLGYTMPIGAEFLYIGHEDAEPYLWFIVETDDPLVMREFFVARGGEEIPAWCTKQTHLASISARTPQRGWVLLHVFEQTQG
jgi:hypothetical protein